MWYWDYFPSGNHHHKKPPTKEQIRKMKEAYERADEISQHVRELEEKEKKKISEKTENTLDEIFL